MLIRKTASAVHLRERRGIYGPLCGVVRRHGPADLGTWADSCRHDTAGTWFVRQPLGPALHFARIATRAEEFAKLV